MPLFKKYYQSATKTRTWCYSAMPVPGHTWWRGHSPRAGKAHNLTPHVRCGTQYGHLGLSGLSGRSPKAGKTHNLAHHGFTTKWTAHLVPFSLSLSFNCIYVYILFKYFIVKQVKILIIIVKLYITKWMNRLKGEKWFY